MISNISIQNNLIDFLLSKDWKQLNGENKFITFTPPQSLDLGREFSLFLPKNIEAIDFPDDAEKISSTLSEIYDEDADDLFSIIIEGKEIFSLHFEDDTAIHGKPSLPKFNKINERIEKLLKDNASFVIVQKPHMLDSQTEESERYINQCRFLKNKEGSVITKIQLPSEEEIKEKNLFEDSIKATQINEKLIDIVSFVNDSLLKSEVEISDAFLRNNQAFVNVNVIERVRELYNEVRLVDIQLELKNKRVNKKTEATMLNPEKMRNLQTFSKTVRMKMNEMFEDIIFGKVVELKSKDVESDNNVIKVLARVKNVDTHVTVTLNPKDYQKAIDAHKSNHTLKLTGSLEKEKTQFKMTELKELKVL